MGAELTTRAWVAADARELITIDEDELSVPAGCVDCQVLTLRAAALARGLVPKEEQISPGITDIVYYPLGKESEIFDEQRSRAIGASWGNCKYIKHQPNCWRAERE